MIPNTRLLRAGPLSLKYLHGEVRDVRVGGVEVVRRIYGTVRDRNWGTVAPQVLEESTEEDSNGFRVAFEMRHQEGPIDFQWRGEICSKNDNSLVFRFDGEALHPFERNRIGLCLLLPLSAGGARVRVEHGDGGGEEAILAREIAPHQPFVDVASFEHEFAPGAWARLNFEGEVFEVEDQRNWSDASWKFYGTPLSLPFPVLIPERTRVTQSIRLSVRGKITPPTESLDSSHEEEVSIVVQNEPVGIVPPLGLALGRQGMGDLSESEAALLRLLNLSHLRLDLHLQGEEWRRRLARGLRYARSLGTALEIALHVENEDELRKLARELEQVLAPQVLEGQGFEGGGAISSWLLLSPDLSAVDAHLTVAARKHLVPVAPHARWASGSDANFAELNRARPAPEALQELDAISFACNPQVHAFDDASLFETLQALPEMVASARLFSHGRGVALSPLSLRPRFNAVATRRAQNAENVENTEDADDEPGNAVGEDPGVDARQSTLLAAAWATGALAALAPCKLERLTLFEATGPRGLFTRLAHGSDSVLFPVFHVLAALAPFKNAHVLRAHASSDRVAALAISDGARTRLLLANLSAESARVQARCEGSKSTSSQARARVLDEPGVASASRSARLFIEPGELIPLRNGAARLNLGPYSIATVDFESTSEVLAEAPSST